MIALLALGLAAGTSGATPAPYPAAAVIEAFKGLCGNPESLDVVRAAARDNGWEQFTPVPDSNLGKIFTTGKSMATDLLAKTPATAKTQMSNLLAFRKTVAGREIDASTDMVAMAVPGKAVSVISCQIYDFAAPAMLTADATTQLTDRPPDKTVDYPDRITLWSWNNGLNGAGSTLNVAFVPRTSPLANPARLMVLGLVIKSMKLTVIV